MVRISNEVLLEKIHNIDKKIDTMLPDHKLNTEFRLSAKGAMAILAVIFGFIGSTIMWIIQKLFGRLGQN